MKHCPNPDCPFLKEYKMVAEFSDEAELCRDCGAQLVAGEAPEVALPEPAAPTTADQPRLAENLTTDLVMLCAVDSEVDADFYKTSLEFQDIPVAIVRKVATEENVDALATPLFELQVRRSDLMRATYLLDTLDGETDEIELDDEVYDNEVYDEDEEVAEDELKDNLQRPEMTGDDETESALSPVDRLKSSSPDNAPSVASFAATPADQVNTAPTNRFNQTILLILIAIIVILVVWFLLSR